MVAQERLRREVDLGKRQAKVENLLQETKEQAERLKVLEDDVAAKRLERQVEMELAKERAGVSGRSVEAELLEIRARHHSEDEVAAKTRERMDEERRIEDAMKLEAAWLKVVSITRSEDPQQAVLFLSKSYERVLFLSKSHERVSTLQGMGEALESRTAKLRTQVWL
ncbi:hypothetical protein T484DRAFT_1765626 [Baffinella frigidus]|nr:hypothetical protein T484DRAFT_1765626 [Cryptophyta sp. CCMP2293]